MVVLQHTSSAAWTRRCGRPNRRSFSGVAHCGGPGDWRALGRFTAEKRLLLLLLAPQELMLERAMIKAYKQQKDEQQLPYQDMPVAQMGLEELCFSQACNGLSSFIEQYLASQPEAIRCSLAFRRVGYWNTWLANHAHQHSTLLAHTPCTHSTC